MGGVQHQVEWGGLFAVLFWLIGLFILYKTIYWAVKHAINDSRALRELRDEIRALRSSGPPSGAAGSGEQGGGTQRT